MLNIISIKLITALI